MAYTDITSQGHRFLGNGQRELYPSYEVWPDGRPRLGYKGWSQDGPDLAIFDDEVLGLTAGEYPILVTTDAVYWVDASLKTYQWKKADGSFGVADIPIGGTSQGISHFNYSTGKLVWMDETFLTPRPLVRKYSHGGWDFGMDPDMDRFLAVTPQGELKVVANVYSNIGPRGRGFADGSAVCAISNPKDGVTHFVESKDFMPYTAPPETQPIKPFSISRPFWVGKEKSDVGHSNAGNVTWGYVDSRMFVEAYNWLPSDDICQRQLLGLLIFPIEQTANGTIQADVVGTIAAAKKFGKPVIIGWDMEEYQSRHERPEPHSAEEWEIMFNKEGIRTIPMVRAYPGDRAAISIDRFPPGTECLINTAVYPQSWTKQAANTAMEIADLTAQAFPDKVVGKLAFGDYGVGRGQSMWETMDLYWQGQRFPLRGEDLVGRLLWEPAPPAPEVPTPEKPKRKGSGNFWGGIFKLLGRIFR